MTRGRGAPVVSRCRRRCCAVSWRADGADVPAADVAGLIDALEERWPGMRDRLADSRRRSAGTSSLRRRGAGRLETPLRPGADVVFLTAVSGG